jgi:hypothetical protein
MLIKMLEFKGDRIINRLGWFLSDLAEGSQSKKFCLGPGKQFLELKTTQRYYFFLSPKTFSDVFPPLRTPGLSLF